MNSFRVDDRARSISSSSPSAVEPISRRALLAAVAAAAQTSGAPARLETLRDWLHANRGQRASALKLRLERIASEDRAIHSWVQVLPQEPTGDGTLYGIPFGVKDTIETRGLATES